MSVSIAWLLTQLASGAPSAEAAQAPVLAWQAPAGCPQLADVRARLQRLLGSPDPSRPRRSLEVRALVRTTDTSGFLLELDTTEGTERYSRVLESSTCDGVTDAGTLVIALAVDPELATHIEQRPSAPYEPERRSPVAAELGTEQQPPPRQRQQPGPALAPTPRRTSDFRWGVVASALADAGTLPGLAVGPGWALFLGAESLSLELGGVGLLPRSGTVPGHPNEGGRVDLLAAQLRGCGRLVRVGLDFRTCADFEIGRSYAQSFGATQNSSAHALWLAPGVGLVGTRRLNRAFSWRLQADMIFPLQRHEFIVENAGLAHRAGALVARLGLGVEAIFP